MNARKRAGVSGSAAATQPVERGPRRGQRDLLLEHDVEQRGEARLPVPERWRAVPLDDPGEIGVPRCEVRDRRVERGPRERLDQTTDPPAVNPCAGSGSNDRSSAPRSHARAFSPSEGRW